MANKVILAGGSGLIGRALARTLQAAGWEPVILTRAPAEGAAFREVAWNGETGGAWTAELREAAAIVNLAGSPINRVHTLAASREILDSRVHAVQALGKALARQKQTPAVWVQASAVGYYGNRGPDVADEHTPPGRDFLAEVCRQWEEAFRATCPAATRAVVLRLGIVLAPQGGAYPELAALTRRFLGGTAGAGRQGFSWVHSDDVTTAFQEALQREDFTGAYNVCAPQPVTNAQLMAALRHNLRRPWVPPAPAWVVRLAATQLMKTEPSLILEGRLCRPRRLLEQGFRFKFSELAGALADLARARR